MKDTATTTSVRSALGNVLGILCSPVLAIELYFGVLRDIRGGVEEETLRTQIYHLHLACDYACVICCLAALCGGMMLVAHKSMVCGTATLIICLILSAVFIALPHRAHKMTEVA